MPVFVVFKWKGPPPRHAYLSGATQETAYSSLHVNAIAKMLRKTQIEQPRLICVTDDPSGLANDISVYPIPERGIDMIQKYGGRFCKLIMFSKEFQDFVGEKFIYIDLDTAISGDLSDLLKSSADLIVLKGYKKTWLNKKLKPIIKYFLNDLAGKDAAKKWQDLRKQKPPRSPFSSTFMVITPGIGHNVWTDFDGDTAWSKVRNANLVGTDQAWLHLHFKGKIKYADNRDGLWRFNEIRRYIENNKSMPEDLRLIAFPGRPEEKPWVDELRHKYPWLRELYPDL